MEQLPRALAARQAVGVVGREGVGKAYVLRAALASVANPQLVVFIEGESRDAEDVLRAIFEQLYDAHQVEPTPEVRRAAFAGVRAVIVVDNGEHAGNAADSELRRLLLEALDAEDRSIVEALAGACGATLGLERLRRLASIHDVDVRAARLEDEGLFRSGSPRYRLAGALADLEVRGAPERVADELIRFASKERPDSVVTEAPAALAILDWAGKHERHRVTIRLGRAIAPAMLYGHRWSAWGHVLEEVLGSAIRLGDQAARAWALHHLGTRAYALGDPSQAVTQAGGARRARAARR